MKIRLPHHFPPNKSPMKINVLQTILYQSKKKKKKGRLLTQNRVIHRVNKITL